jgi:hypothetical protein
VSEVEWRVGGRDHRGNVYLAFKKPDLMTRTKPPTDAGGEDGEHGE